MKGIKGTFQNKRKINNWDGSVCWRKRYGVQNQEKGLPFLKGDKEGFQRALIIIKSPLTPLYTLKGTSERGEIVLLN